MAGDRAMDKDFVINSFCQKTGLDFKFNEMGLARLRFDRTIIVDFELSDDESYMYIYSSLGRIPSTAMGSDLLKDMMRAHFLGRDSDDTCFALDKDTVMAFRRYDFATADKNDLYTVLELFLDSVELWSNKIKNCQ